MKTKDLEKAIADYFDYRINLIVPNVSWGFFYSHEADIVVLTKAGYLYEVELKVSRSDMKADLKKRHRGDEDSFRQQWENKKLKYLYYAFPNDLLNLALEILPLHVGLLSVTQGQNHHRAIVTEARKPKVLNNYKLTADEKYQLARLGCIKVWKYKKAYLDIIENGNVLPSQAFAK